MSTMSQLYGLTESDGVMVGLYNDEPPEGKNPSSSFAHGKGILASSESAGFW